MNGELSRLIEERDGARSTFIEARFRRDAASVYCDAVVDEGRDLTRPGWAAFRGRQAAMDIAGEHLFSSCGAVADYFLINP